MRLEGARLGLPHSAHDLRRNVRSATTREREPANGTLTRLVTLSEVVRWRFDCFCFSIYNAAHVCGFLNPLNLQRQILCKSRTNLASNVLSVQRKDYCVAICNVVEQIVFQTKSDAMRGIVLSGANVSISNKCCWLHGGCKRQQYCRPGDCLARRGKCAHVRMRKLTRQF